MSKLIPLIIALLPGFVFAGSECRVVEYADHYEAVCTGDAKQAPAASHASPQPAQQQAPGQKQFPVPEQTFEALMATQAQANPDNDEVRIETSNLRRTQREAWLNTSARQ